MKSKFSEVIAKAFEKLFASKSPEDNSFHHELTDVIIECFHIPLEKMPIEEKALIILEALFAHFQNRFAPTVPFRLDTFVSINLSKNIETKKFLTALLYSIYYLDIDFKKHLEQNQRDNFEYLMFQFLAETSSKRTLKRALKNLSLDKMITLLDYSLRRYREGSYILISELKQLHPNLAKLIIGLKRNYYDIDYFHELLLTQTKIKSIPHLLNSLEIQALEQTKKAFSGFTKMIDLMVSFPIRLYEENVKFRKKTLPSYQPDAREKEHADSLKHSLEASLAINPTMTFKDFQEFARLFGLSGHNPYILFCLGKFRQEPLADIFNLLSEQLSNRKAMRKITQEDFFPYTAFAMPIVLHLNQSSQTYQQGLNEIVFAIPTKGKLLEHLATLPSLLSGLSLLVDYLNANSTPQVHLDQYPIFIFDQSSQPIFKKNRRFIERLNRKYKSTIFHFSKQNMLTVAQKLGIQSLMMTSHTGEFGYGGARNAVYLLSHVLKEVFKQGAKTIEEMLTVPHETLLTFFNQCVLGTSQDNCGKTILTFDDDLEIPESNIFAHTLFAQRCAREYHHSFGIQIGRGTQLIYPFTRMDQLFNLDSAVREDKEAVISMLSTTRWIGNELHASWLTECLSKPSLCLNLPLPCEENQIRLIALHNSLLKTSFHLPGTRYPKKTIPTHFFVGLDEFLEKYIPYALQAALSTTFIDAGAILNTSTLPWSEQRFTHLREACEYIVNKETEILLKLNFWRKVDEFFASKIPKSSLNDCIRNLLEVDLEFCLQKTLENKSLLSSEKATLKKIAKIYSHYQKDAQIFREFGHLLIAHFKTETIPENDKEIVERIKRDLEKKTHSQFIDYPLTYGFYLMIRSIALGGFRNIILTLKNKCKIE